MTTGGIPSFLDVILNFDETDTSSSLANQDTWLAQMKEKGKTEKNGGGKLILYGDDTWLKLFPETFDRADGTSSFFVSVCLDLATSGVKYDLLLTSVLQSHYGSKSYSRMAGSLSLTSGLGFH